MPTNLNQSQVNKLFSEGEATRILTHCPESQKCFSKKESTHVALRQVTTRIQMEARCWLSKSHQIYHWKTVC